jgi:hypothetical protein
MIRKIAIPGELRELPFANRQSMIRARRQTPLLFSTIAT